MPQLSQQQLARLWIQAGGDPSQAGTAAAVAMAESNGNTGSTNHNTDGSTDLGPWQINNKAHPNYNQQQLLSNPLYNAKAAVAISSNGKSWGPWVTYTTGAYKKFMSGFTGSARNGNNVPGTTTPTETSPVASALGLGGLGETLDLLSNPVRLGKIIIGGILLVIALDRLSGIKALPVPV